MKNVSFRLRTFPRVVGQSPEKADSPQSKTGSSLSERFRRQSATEIPHTLRRFSHQDKGVGISRSVGTDSRFAGKGEWTRVPLFQFEGSRGELSRVY